MQIGVLTTLFSDQELADVLEQLDDLPVNAIECGVGGWPAAGHLPVDEYLDDDTAQAELNGLLDGYGMEISALATHNNPLHPDDDRALVSDRELRDAITLADQLDVGTVTCFSGLPAGSEEDTVPNWVTAPWPPEHQEALAYQWEVGTDYWSGVAGYAAKYDVDVAIEMHPNMLVYNPETLLRLRSETNERVGANLDPSHLYWQGIDVQAAIRELGEADAIHHVHAKDAAVYEENARTDGVLDTTPYTEEADRAWLFRTVGYGHGEKHWKDVVSTLRMMGYDGTVSIEHEDSLTSPEEGLEKAVDILDRAVFDTAPGEAYWTG